MHLILDPTHGHSGGSKSNEAMAPLPGAFQASAPMALRSCYNRAKPGRDGMRRRRRRTWGLRRLGHCRRPAAGWPDPSLLAAPTQLTRVVKDRYLAFDLRSAMNETLASGCEP